MLTKSNKACFYPEVHFRSWQGICAQSATTANRKCTRNKFEYFRKLFFKVLLNLPPGTVVQWVRVNQWPYKYKLQLRTWVNSGSDARIELIFIYVVSFICLWAKSSKIKWLLREQACYWPLITGLPLVAVHLSVQLHHLWSILVTYMLLSPGMCWFPTPPAILNPSPVCGRQAAGEIVLLNVGQQLF